MMKAEQLELFDSVCGCRHGGGVVVQLLSSAVLSQRGLHMHPGLM